MKIKDHTNIWSDWFTYDESSPSFLVWNHDKLTNKGSPTKTKKGMTAGWKDTDYYKVTLCGNTFKVHHIIYEIHFGRVPEGLWIDQKDGNGLNNQLDNLRAVLPKVNTRNRAKPVINTSGVVGVAFNSKLSKNKLIRHNYWVVTRDCIFDGLTKMNRNAISVEDCQDWLVINCTVPDGMVNVAVPGLKSVIRTPFVA